MRLALNRPGRRLSRASPRKIALQRLGAKSVLACCTHAVLSPPAVQRIKDSNIEELIITNTIPLPPEKKLDKIKVLSVAPMFGEAMIRIYKQLSVSSLFD